MQEAKANIDTTKPSVCILDNRLGYLSEGVKRINLEKKLTIWYTR